jgi:hypothetical protein
MKARRPVKSKGCSYIASLLSRLGLTRSASVAPTSHARSVSVAPTSPSRSASTVPARISMPGISLLITNLRHPYHRSSTCIAVARSQVPYYVDVTTETRGRGDGNTREGGGNEREGNGDEREGNGDEREGNGNVRARGKGATTRGKAAATQGKATAARGKAMVAVAAPAPAEAVMTGAMPLRLVSQEREGELRMLKVNKMEMRGKGAKRKRCRGQRGAAALVGEAESDEEYTDKVVNDVHSKVERSRKEAGAQSEPGAPRRARGVAGSAPRSN